MVSDDLIDVSVVFALPREQISIDILLPRGATVADAITAAGLESLRVAGVGVFGKACATTRILRSGERVELYRELFDDPKNIRRLRAKSKPDSGSDRGQSRD